MKTLVVEEGYSEAMVEKFAAEGIIEEQPGFIDLSVVKKRKKKQGNEELLVLIRWESEADWQAWETCDVHLAGHRANRGKPKPSYILDGTQYVYHQIGYKSYRKPDHS